MHRLVYSFTIAALAALAIACLVLVVTHGWSLLGIAGIVGALVFTALMFSYAGSARAKHSPIPR